MKLTLLYGHPDDPAAFEEYYSNTHMPMVPKIPAPRKSRRRRREKTASEQSRNLRRSSSESFDVRAAAR